MGVKERIERKQGSEGWYIIYNMKGVSAVSVLNMKVMVAGSPQITFGTLSLICILIVHPKPFIFFIFVAFFCYRAIIKRKNFQN